jgi:hypothetical protein
LRSHEAANAWLSSWGPDDDDALRETIAVLADAELLRAHADGTAALYAEDSLDADGLARAMRSVGRLPPA